MMKSLIFYSSSFAAMHCFQQGKQKQIAAPGLYGSSASFPCQRLFRQWLGPKKRFHSANPMNCYFFSCTVFLLCFDLYDFLAIIETTFLADAVSHLQSMALGACNQPRCAELEMRSSFMFPLFRCFTLWYCHL
jgi:hypothetical protein